MILSWLLQELLLFTVIHLLRPHRLCAKLRPANLYAAAGSVKQLDWIVKQFREKRPRVQIVIRADCGFCREHVMESNQVDFVLGLAKNARWKRILGKELHDVKQRFEDTDKAARVYKDFR